MMSLNGLADVSGRGLCRGRVPELSQVVLGTESSGYIFRSRGVHFQNEVGGIMAHKKKTSKPAGSSASKTLKSKSTGKASKSAAGSALAQRRTTKVTSSKAASSASKVLRDGRTSKRSKSAAGSALSQKHASKRRKK